MLWFSFLFIFELLIFCVFFLILWFGCTSFCYMFLCCCLIYYYLSFSIIVQFFCRCSYFSPRQHLSGSISIIIRSPRPETPRGGPRIGQNTTCFKAYINNINHTNNIQQNYSYQWKLKQIVFVPNVPSKKTNNRIKTTV